MSITTPNIPYIYPAHTALGDLAIDPTKPTILNNPGIQDVYKMYNDYFKANGTYDSIKSTLLVQLNSILGRTEEEAKLTIKDLDTDKFYTDAQTIKVKISDGESEDDPPVYKTYRIDQNHCREGFMAYRFYLKEIATRIKTIDNYIQQGQEALEALANLFGTAQEINDLAHTYITQLEIYDKFIYEELKEFLTYYKYNEDTKQWDIVQLDVFDQDSSKNYAWTQVGNESKYKDLTRYIWEDNQWKYYTSYKENVWCKTKNEIEINDKIFQFYIKPNNGFPWFIGIENDGGSINEIGQIKYEDQKWQIKLFTSSDFSVLETPDKALKYFLNPNILNEVPFIDSKLQNLRELEVATTKTQTDGTSGEGSMQLTSFNALTLFDRLRYIRYYYNLMFSQTDGVDRTNSRFPDNYDTGYPCMPDIPSIDAKKATQSLGALELFYVGYLINRDGPVNALSSFFEVKVDALRNNVALSSKKIEALNLYLDFINSGLDQLNKNTGHRASRGSIIALTYLCGQNMYNLFEDENGDKYFVIPRVTESNTYFLIKADDDGKKFFLGDSSYNVDTKPEGNNDCGIGLINNFLYATRWDSEPSNKYAYSHSNKAGTQINNFQLPTQIECSTVAPSSVMGYLNANNSDPSKITKLVTESDNNVLGSWTDAFSRKTQYINTAIDTINTDVTLDRSKIDTFDSLTSTFRSRAQDTYQNILSNVR